MEKKRCNKDQELLEVRARPLLQRSCDLVVHLGSVYNGVKAISMAEGDAADLLCFYSAARKGCTM